MRQIFLASSITLLCGGIVAPTAIAQDQIPAEGIPLEVPAPLSVPAEPQGDVPQPLDAPGSQQDEPQAAVSNSVDLGRAKNFARQAAESANGGLNKYRAEFAMHGPATEAPYVANPDGSWTFTFKGTLYGSSPAEDTEVESVVTVTSDSIVTVDYNGPVRAAAQPPTNNSSASTPAPQADSSQAVVSNSVDLNRAKNFARQAAESANGGLNKYRAEAAMHGLATEAPYVTNPDGSWTFTFKGTLYGSSPGANTEVESVVTVTPDSIVTVDYNGPVR